MRLAKDPTSEGFGMLRQNFKILKDTDKPRLEESIKTLERYLNNKSYRDVELTEKQKVRVNTLLEEFRE